MTNVDVAILLCDVLHLPFSKHQVVSEDGILSHFPGNGSLVSFHDLYSWFYNCIIINFSCSRKLFYNSK